MGRTKTKVQTRRRTPTPLETAVNRFLTHKWSPLEKPAFLLSIPREGGQMASYSLDMVDYGEDYFMQYCDGHQLDWRQRETTAYVDSLAARAPSCRYSWGFQWSYKLSEDKGNEASLFYSGSNGRLRRGLRVRRHLESSEGLYDLDVQDPLDEKAYMLFKEGLQMALEICIALDLMGATRIQEGGTNTPPARLVADDPALFNVLKTYGAFKDPVSVARLSATSRAWNKTLAQTRKQLLEGYPKEVLEALKKLHGYNGWTAETVAGYMQFGNRASHQSRNPITTIRFPNDLDEEAFMFYATAPGYSMNIRPSIEKACDIIVKAFEKPYGARIELRWPSRSTGEMYITELSVQFGPEDYSWWGQDNHILVDAKYESNEDMTIKDVFRLGPFRASSLGAEAKKNLGPIVELINVAALRKGPGQKKVWDPTYKAVPAAAPDLHKKFTVAGFFKQARILKTIKEIDDLVKSVVKTPGRLAEIARSDEMKGILQRNSPNRSQRYAAAVIIDKAYDDKGVREHFRKEYANTPALRENPENFGLRRSVRQGAVIFSRTPRGR